jgi:hypothetical protein
LPSTGAELWQGLEKSTKAKISLWGGCWCLKNTNGPAGGYLEGDLDARKTPVMKPVISFHYLLGNFMGNYDFSSLETVL